MMVVSNRMLIGISLLIAIFFLSLTNFFSALILAAIITGLIMAITNRPPVQPDKPHSKQRNTRTDKPEKKESAAPNGVFEWPELNEFQFDISDESRYQASLSKIIKQQKNNRNKAGELALNAFIIPEDSNPSDDKAVRVDIDKLTVGYFSKKDARSFRRRLAAKKLRNQVTQCMARIIESRTLGNGKASGYSVALDIKPFK